MIIQATVVVETVNSLVGRSEAVDEVLFLMTFIDIFKAVPCMAVLLGVTMSHFGSLLDERLTLIRSVVGVGAATAAVRLSQEVLPHRPRPIAQDGVDIVVSRAIDAGSLESLMTSSSFPSDHAALTLGIVAAVLYLNRRAGLWLGAYAVVAVLFPRLYFGYHYASDMVVGGLVGIGITLAVLRLPLGQWQERIHGWIATRPGLSMALGFVILFEVSSLFLAFRTVLNAYGLG